MAIRQAQAAGQFYPALKDLLSKELDRLIDKSVTGERVLGAVSPHAGYVYSGMVAGEVFSRIKLPDTVIIIGPNHTGLGDKFSLMAKGSWINPLGKVDIDEECAKKILLHSRYLSDDYLAHTYEHSIEVQLPFLQYLKPGFGFIPIIVANAELGVYKNIGEELAKAVKEINKDILIIASSDMTHYETQDEAERKDKLAIEAILKLDEDALYKEVMRHDISMCGYAPCIIMLSAVKYLGASSAELVEYRTSAAVTQDFSSVVGYAGIIVK